MRKILALVLLFSSLLFTFGCGKQSQEKVTISFAAAASLEKMFEQRLIPMYAQQNPSVKLEGIYGSSGKLQVQLEQGLAAAIFISAAEKQLQALEAKGLVASSQPLLKNELVLIVPATAKTDSPKSWEDFARAKQPAIGDPKFVPAGQYAQEALVKLGLWQQVSPRLSLGSNVVEVLQWVAQGSADAGLVYATDAASTGKVRVVAKTPAGLLQKPIVYPLVVLKSGSKRPEVQDFVRFLQSDAAKAVYREYGFSL